MRGSDEEGERSEEGRIGYKGKERRDMLKYMPSAGVCSTSTHTHAHTPQKDH